MATCLDLRLGFKPCPKGLHWDEFLEFLCLGLWGHCLGTVSVHLRLPSCGCQLVILSCNYLFSNLFSNQHHMQCKPTSNCTSSATSWWLQHQGCYIKHTQSTAVHLQCFQSGFAELPSPAFLPSHSHGFIYANMVYLRAKNAFHRTHCSPSASKVNDLCLNFPLG